MSLRRTVVAAATHDLVAPLWRPLIRDRVAILMFHRFADEERRVAGHTVEQLRRDLDLLRKWRVRVASLPDLLNPDTAAALDTPAVVVTVDDGYADFARIAAPLFDEFDIPSTVFLVTGVVDRNDWYWWDRVEYAVTRTARHRVELSLADGAAQWALTTPAERTAAIGAITERLKLVADTERLRQIDAIAALLDVELPTFPPAHLAPMTWDDVERCRGRVTFAPHTVSHPILTRVSDDQARAEIVESWQTLQARTQRTVPVFCYPNGTFGDREVDAVASAGLSAAVTTEPGYAMRGAFSTGARSPADRNRFRIPRFAYNGDAAQFAQIISGFEQLKMRLRGRRRAAQPGG